MNRCHPWCGLEFDVPAVVEGMNSVLGIGHYLGNGAISYRRWQVIFRVHVMRFCDFVLVCYQLLAGLRDGCWRDLINLPGRWMRSTLR